MSASIPPLPYKTPLTNEDGLLTQAWAKWLLLVFVRIGETSAPSNKELENQPALDLAAVESDIASLQLLTTSQGASITLLKAQVIGLQQGRQL